MMQFQHVMARLANQENEIVSLARRFGWSNDRALHTLLAYSTGNYFPTLEELKAINNSPSLITEWRLAMVAMHLTMLTQMGADLSVIGKPETVLKWKRGITAMSAQNRKLVLEKFGIDLDHVPVGKQYVHGEGRTLHYRVNANHTMLYVGGAAFRLRELEPGYIVVDLSNDARNLEQFLTLMEPANLNWTQSGDFMSVELITPPVTLAVLNRNGYLPKQS